MYATIFWAKCFFVVAGESFRWPPVRSEIYIPHIIMSSENTLWVFLNTRKDYLKENVYDV